MGQYYAMLEGTPWHRQGLFAGMHWAWWLLWLATIAVLIWAFWRLAAERREAHARCREIVDAEEILRGRFARGEIGEAELVDGMRALRGSRSAEVGSA
jgi:uncharacterized membrane protein